MSYQERQKPIVEMLVFALGRNGYSRSCSLPEKITLHNDQLERLVDSIDDYILQRLK